MKTEIKDGQLVVTIKTGDKLGKFVYKGEKTAIITKTLSKHELKGIGHPDYVD